jgi:hypothetical protein
MSRKHYRENDRCHQFATHLGALIGARGLVFLGYSMPMRCCICSSVIPLVSG